MNYVNELCSGCGRKFTENDDIVTCPVCGTPQHRECWKENGKCVNEHLHEDGFEWKPRHSEKPKETQIPERKKTCLVCGEENPEDAAVCSRCGQPFGEEPDFLNPLSQGNAKNDKEYSYKPPFEVNYEEPPKTEDDSYYEPQQSEPSVTPGPQPFVYRFSGLEKTVLEKDTKDFAAYTRASIPSYYKKFKKFENGKKFTFNFAAFFLSPFWFFFRKLYKEGIVFLLLSLSITVALYPTMTKLGDQQAVLYQKVNEAMSSEEEITDEQYEEITQQMYEFVKTSSPVLALNVGLRLILALAAGFLADKLYMKKFLADMKAVDEAEENVTDSSPRRLLIMRKGGVSLFIPVVAFAAMQLILYLLLEVFFE